MNKGVLKGDRKGSEATWVVLETKEEGGRAEEMRNGELETSLDASSFSVRSASLTLPFPLHTLQLSPRRNQPSSLLSPGKLSK